MKKIFLFLTLFVFANTMNAQNVKSDIQKVDALLKQMTLEEKVGQMTQVTLAVIAKGGWANADGTIDAALLKKAVVDYKVGSI
jgi:beta-glucosidase